MVARYEESTMGMIDREPGSNGGDRWTASRRVAAAVPERGIIIVAKAAGVRRVR